MSDEIHIPAEDQQSIDALVAAFRSRVENLYRMAYLQGAIDEAKKERDKMLARAA